MGKLLLFQPEVISALSFGEVENYKQKSGSMPLNLFTTSFFKAEFIEATPFASARFFWDTQYM